MTEIDLSRFTDLSRALGEELPQIVAELVAGIQGAIDAARAAIGRGDLDACARSAHSCRNDALVVGAQELLDALTALELVARRGRVEDAAVALRAVLAVWPRTQAELERAAQQGGHSR